MKDNVLKKFLLWPILFSVFFGIYPAQATFKGQVTNSCKKHASYFIYRASGPLYRKILKPANKRIILPVKTAATKMLTPVKNIWSPLFAWKDRTLNKILKKNFIKLKPILKKLKSMPFAIKKTYYKNLISFFPNEKRHKVWVEMVYTGYRKKYLTYQDAHKLLNDYIPRDKLAELININNAKKSMQMLFDPEDKLRELYASQIATKVNDGRWKNWLTTINLNSEQLFNIQKLLPAKIKSQQKKLYQNFIQYSQSYKGKKSIEVLSLLDRIIFTQQQQAQINPNYIYNADNPKQRKHDKAYLAKFNDLLQSFSDHEEVMTKLTLQRIHKKKPHLSTQEATLRAQKYAKKKRFKYENIKLACRAKVSNTYHRAARVNLKNFYIMLGLSTTYAGYAWANMDEDWDREWWAKLGFEQAVTLIFSYVNSRAFSNPKDTKLRKFFKGLGIGTVGDVVTGGAYVSLFGDQTPDANKKMNKLLKSKNFSVKIKKLFKKWDNQLVYEKFVAAFYQYKYKAFIEKYLSKNPQLIINYQLNNSEEAQWDQLWTSAAGEKLKKQIEKDHGGGEFSLDMISAADFSDQQMRNVLLKELADKMRKNPEGGLFQTDNPGRDLLYYNRAYGLPAAVKGLLIGLLTYKLLCERGINKNLNMSLAITAFILDGLGSRVVYFSGRKYYIGF